MPSQLDKAIQIAKQSGDKVIVVDQNTNEAYVLMSLDQYDALLQAKKEVSETSHSLTEEGLIDKINRDIEVWKNEHFSDENEAEDSFLLSKDSKIESSSDSSHQADMSLRASQPNWQIPNNVKKGAQALK